MAPVTQKIHTSPLSKTLRCFNDCVLNCISEQRVNMPSEWFLMSSQKGLDVLTCPHTALWKADPVGRSENIELHLKSPVISTSVLILILAEFETAAPQVHTHILQEHYWVTVDPGPFKIRIWRPFENLGTCLRSPSERFGLGQSEQAAGPAGLFCLSVLLLWALEKTPARGSLGLSEMIVLL